MTLQPEYEAAQVGVFGDMFLKGYIYRGRKPVHWSPSSRTALAEVPRGSSQKPKHFIVSVVCRFSRDSSNMKEKRK